MSPRKSWSPWFARHVDKRRALARGWQPIFEFIYSSVASTTGATFEHTVISPDHPRYADVAILE